MAWTAPMTAIAGSVFTAAQFNTFVRDNLAETAPAKALRPGGHFVTSATNQIVERLADSNSDLNLGTTASTTYDDLDAPAVSGPSVTVTTGVQCFIYLHAAISNSGAGSARAAYETSGATAIAAADNRGLGFFGVAGATVTASMCHFQTDLTPGSHTFTMKYRASSGTASISSRRIGVIPF